MRGEKAFGASFLWTAWMQVLRRPFAAKRSQQRERIEVLDRLHLGGKKALLLVAIEGRRFLVGIGEEAAPSVSALQDVASTRPSRSRRAALRMTASRRRLR